MDSSLAKKNTTRFLIYSFVGLLVFSMGVFAMLGVYMSRKSTKTIHEVGEIYMSGMSEQMARHFENIIELRFAQVEGIVSVVPSKSADKEAMYADLVYRAQVRGFEYLALCSPNGRFETLCGEAFQPVNPPPFVDALGVALRTHGREAAQQQRPADAAALLFVQHACRTEEIRSRRIITGITQDFFAPRGDEARNSRAGKAHVALPCCGKAGVLLHPFHHTKFIRRHCAADLYALIPRARRLRIFRQVV